MNAHAPLKSLREFADSIVFLLTFSDMELVPRLYWVNMFSDIKLILFSGALIYIVWHKPT